MRNVLTNCILTFGLITSCILYYSSISTLSYNIISDNHIYSLLTSTIKNSIINGVQICKSLGPGSTIRLKLEVPAKLIGFNIIILDGELLLFDTSNKVIVKYSLPNIPSVFYVKSTLHISREYIFIYFYNVYGEIFIKL